MNAMCLCVAISVDDIADVLYDEQVKCRRLAGPSLIL